MIENLPNQDCAKDWALNTPPAGSFSPSIENGGIPALLWELFRRSPDFRHVAHYCVVSWYGDEAGAPEPNRQRQPHASKPKILKFIAELVESNPLASHILQWLFNGDVFLIKFHLECEHVRENYGVPFDSHFFENSAAIGASIDELLQMTDATSLKKTKEAFESNPDPVRLQIANGAFTLDTPWDETPEVFRYCFEWMCSDLELSRLWNLPRILSDSTAGFQPRPGRYVQDIDWDVISKWPLAEIESVALDASAAEFGSEQNAEGAANQSAFPPSIKHRLQELWPKLMELGEVLESHVVFLIPQFPSNEADVTALKAEFKNVLEELKATSSTVTNNYQRAFLAAPEKWRAFVECREYAGCTSQRSGLDVEFSRVDQIFAAAVSKYAAQREREGTVSESRDNKGHIRKNARFFMEMMSTLYPKFQWSDFLATSGDMDREATDFIHERSCKIARLRAKYLGKPIADRGCQFGTIR
jgi:hypothetical protein